MIRISEVIHEEGIVLDLQSREKVSVIKELVAKLVGQGLVEDEESFLADILKR